MHLGRWLTHHVRHVVGRVEVDAVPACRESQVDHDAGGTWLLGEVFRLREASAHVLQTCVGQLRVFIDLSATTGRC
jgi:hypothetical protein